MLFYPAPHGIEHERVEIQVEMVGGHPRYAPVLVRLAVVHVAFQFAETNEVHFALFMARMRNGDAPQNIRDMGARLFEKLARGGFFGRLAGIGLAAGEPDDGQSFFEFLGDDCVEPVEHDGH